MSLDSRRFVVLCNFSTAAGGQAGPYDGSTTAVRRQYDGSTTAAPRGPIMYAFFKSDFGVGFAARRRVRITQERREQPRSNYTTAGPSSLCGESRRVRVAMAAPLGEGGLASGTNQPAAAAQPRNQLGFGHSNEYLAEHTRQDTRLRLFVCR